MIATRAAQVRRANQGWTLSGDPAGGILRCPVGSLTSRFPHERRGTAALRRGITRRPHDVLGGHHLRGLQVRDGATVAHRAGDGSAWRSTTVPLAALQGSAVAARSRIRERGGKDDPRRDTGHRCAARGCQLAAP